MALGATEQHGHHMPLATDALIGDHLALARHPELGRWHACADLDRSEGVKPVGREEWDVSLANREPPVWLSA
jgi:Creatinine amidohydrolase